jgi:hypothetical protein
VEKKRKEAMLELDYLSFDLLETLYPALKKNKHLPLAINKKLPTWPRRNDLPLSHYFGRVRESLRIFPPSDLPGTSPLISTPRL